MRRKWFLFVAPPIFVLFVILGGQVVQHLWNWLAPTLFDFKRITFWQALGLLALCRILFGGFGFRGSHGSYGRRRMEERCSQMSPEEKEKIRQGLHGRWGSTPPDPKPGV